MSSNLLLLLFTAALVAGCADAMAGGGGILTVPALLLAGLSPVNALATNKLQGSFGTMTAAVSMTRRGLAGSAPVAGPFIAAAVAAGIGAVSVRAISTAAASILVPVLLLGTAGYFILSPSMTADRAPRLGARVHELVIVPCIGFYDGIFGPGTGAFLVASGVHFRGQRLVLATARAKIFNLATNLGALAVFVVGGEVVWRAGAVMAVGQVGGAYLGSAAVAKGGARLIRPVVVVMCLSMLVQYLWKNRSLYL